MNGPSLLLRRSLIANALFSCASGALLFAFAGSVGAWLGVPSIALMAVGVLLVGFSGLVFALGRSPRLHRGWTRLVIVSDIGWVAGSAVLMTGWPIDITRSGLAVIGLVAAIVLLFADLQWLGLRRSQRPA